MLAVSQTSVSIQDVTYSWPRAGENRFKTFQRHTFPSKHKADETIYIYYPFLDIAVYKDLCILQPGMFQVLRVMKTPTTFADYGNCAFYLIIRLRQQVRGVMNCAIITSSTPVRRFDYWHCTPLRVRAGLICQHQWSLEREMGERYGSRSGTRARHNWYCFITAV